MGKKKPPFPVKKKAIRHLRPEKHPPTCRKGKNNKKGNSGVSMRCCCVSSGRRGETWVRCGRVFLATTNESLPSSFYIKRLGKNIEK
jgi:hypothetical protein